MSKARLYLLTPVLGLADLEAFAPRFATALAAGDVASVLVRLASGADAKRIVAPLLELAAEHETALLIESDSRLAARLGADGVHVFPRDVEDAVESRESRIVGVGGLKLRDDAMSAAEAGVDYVMFGEPGVLASPEVTRERVAWWAEIFETPCVAYAASLDEVGPLAAAGADFVALDASIWDNPAEAVHAAMKRIGSGA